MNATVTSFEFMVMTMFMLGMIAAILYHLVRRGL